MRLVEELGLRLAEAHGAARAGLHLARQEDPGADEHEDGQPAHEKLDEPRRVVGRRTGGDLDALALKLGHEARVIGRVTGEVAATHIGPGHILPGDHHRLDLAGIGIVQQLAVGNLAAAAPMPRILEQRDEGEHKQEDDDPQGEVAEIRVHRSILGARGPPDGLRATAPACPITHRQCRRGGPRCQVSRSWVTQARHSSVGAQEKKSEFRAHRRRSRAPRGSAASSSPRAEPAGDARRRGLRAVRAGDPIPPRPQLPDRRSARRRLPAGRAAAGHRGASPLPARAAVNRARRTGPPAGEPLRRGQPVRQGARAGCSSGPRQRGPSLPRGDARGRREDSCSMDPARTECRGPRTSRPGSPCRGRGRAARGAVRGERPLWTHPRQSGKRAACGEAHQDRFGLIVTGMGGEDEIDARSSGMFREEAVAGCAGGVLKAGLRLVAAPAQHLMGQAQRVGRAPDGLGLGGGVRPQSVVDRGNKQGNLRPQACGGVHQRRRIGAARDGQEHLCRPARLQPGAERVENRIVRSGHAVQRARFCSRVTPWRTPVPAFGNLRSSSARVAQACSLAPSAFRDTLSFSIASGAWAERA